MLYIFKHIFDGQPQSVSYLEVIESREPVAIKLTRVAMSEGMDRLHLDIAWKLPPGFVCDCTVESHVEHSEVLEFFCNRSQCGSLAGAGQSEDLYPV